MIQEQYISFETAKLLKEKGFSEHCIYVYLHDGTEDLWNVDKEDIECQKPTQAVVMRWLREIHNLYISIDCRCDRAGLYFCYDIFKIIGKQSDFLYCSGPDEYEDDAPVDYTYEDACEEAIKQCLKRFI